MFSYVAYYKSLGEIEKNSYFKNKIGIVLTHETTLS